MTLNFDDHRPHDDFCCLGWMMVKFFLTDDLWRRRGIAESDLSQAVIPLQSVDYMTVWMLISILCITLYILVPVSRQHLIIILSSSRFDNWTSSDTWPGQKTSVLPTDHYMQHRTRATSHRLHPVRPQLTGRDTAELLELAQDRDVWRELVVE